MNLDRFTSRVDGKKIRVITISATITGCPEREGTMKHREGCDCPVVNPITEWIGGNNVMIIGYECPNCHAKEFRGRIQDAR
jgi:hypothetical protein